jgi:hypothetical protein
MALDVLVWMQIWLQVSLAAISDVAVLHGAAIYDTLAAAVQDQRCAVAAFVSVCSRCLGTSVIFTALQSTGRCGTFGFAAAALAKNAALQHSTCRSHARFMGMICWAAEQYHHSGGFDCLWCS